MNLVGGFGATEGILGVWVSLMGGEINHPARFLGMEPGQFLSPSALMIERRCFRVNACLLQVLLSKVYFFGSLDLESILQRFPQFFCTVAGESSE